MSAGSVLYMTGKRKCTDLGGLFRTMPLTRLRHRRRALDLLVPAHLRVRVEIDDLGSRRHGALEAVWYLLAAASAGVFLHAGIKFPWFVFFQKDSGLRPERAAVEHAARHDLFRGALHRNWRAAGPLYAMLPFPVDYVPYTARHVVFNLQVLMFSGLAFFLMLGWLRRTLTITLDVDWLYRKLGPRVAGISVSRAKPHGLGSRTSAMRKPLTESFGAVRHYYGPDGILARTLPTGAMAFWTTVMLAAYLVLSYF